MKLTEEKEQEQKEGGKRADFGGMPLSVVRKPGEKTEKSKQARKTEREREKRESAYIPGFLVLNTQ